MSGESDVLAALRDIFARVSGQPDVILVPSMALSDVPLMDSLRLLETVALAEEHFGITIDTAQIESIATVGDIARLFEAPT